MATDWGVAVPAGWDAHATMSWLSRVPGAVAARLPYHHNDNKGGARFRDRPVDAAAGRGDVENDDVGGDDAYPDIGEAWIEVLAGPAEPGGICGPDGIGRRPTCHSVDLSAPSPPPSPDSSSSCSNNNNDNNNSNNNGNNSATAPPQSSSPLAPTNTTTSPAQPNPLRLMTRGPPPARAHVPCPAALRLFPRESVQGSYPVSMVSRDGSPAAGNIAGAHRGRLYLTNFRVAFVPSVVNETIHSGTAASGAATKLTAAADAHRHLWDLTFPAIGTVEVRRDPGDDRFLSVLELHGKAFRHFCVGFPHDDVADTALYTALNRAPAYPICAAADAADANDAAVAQPPGTGTFNFDETPSWSQLFQGPWLPSRFASCHGLVA